MNLNKKYYINDDNIPLIEEIIMNDQASEDPNFILGDRRKELVMEEIVLFIRKVKRMMNEKKIEVHVVVRPD
ncbi:MAG: hypothetical protein J6V53_01715 [Alphaproteobacteria bacterium]|nr:hypothetical protein [Alphaproteobacteria bacterium]